MDECLLFYWTKIWILEPILGGLEPPITLAPGILMPYLEFLGLLCAHTHIHSCNVNQK